MEREIDCVMLYVTSCRKIITAVEVVGVSIRSRLNSEGLLKHGECTSYRQEESRRVWKDRGIADVARYKSMNWWLRLFLFFRTFSLVAKATNKSLTSIVRNFAYLKCLNFFGIVLSTSPLSQVFVFFSGNHPL